MELIKVRAVLKNGFISSVDWGPSIDGIIGYASQVDKLGWDRFVETQSLGELSPLDDLPINKIDADNDNWRYQCSLPIYEIHGSHTRYLNRRFNVEEVDNLTFKTPRKVETTKGGYRNARLSRSIKITRYIDWYLVGDLEEVKRLLNLGVTTHVGKNRGSGHGEVAQWIVEKDDAAIEMIEKHNLSLVDNGGIEIDWAIRPPATIQSNKRRVYIKPGVTYA